MLSQCPFCGSHDCRTVAMKDSKDHDYQVVCHTCRASGPVTGNAPEAQERWNGERSPEYILDSPTMPPRSAWEGVALPDGASIGVLVLISLCLVGLGVLMASIG